MQGWEHFQQRAQWNARCTRWWSQIPHCSWRWLDLRKLRKRRGSWTKRLLLAAWWVWFSKPPLQSMPSKMQAIHLSSCPLLLSMFPSKIISTWLFGTWPSLDNYFHGVWPQNNSQPKNYFCMVWPMPEVYGSCMKLKILSAKLLWYVTPAEIISLR